MAVIRSLAYDDSSHYKVVTRLYGSVWPKVLPFCLINAFLTGAVWYIKYQYGIDITSDPSGHTYMATLMSFLIVTRVKILYDNFMANSQYIHDCYRCVRELVHYTCVISMADTSEKAKQWRHQVAYQAILLLRVTMAVLDFRSNPEQEPWAELQRHMPSFAVDEQPDAIIQLEHACRAPCIIAYNVRREILKFRSELTQDTLQHPCNEYLRLIDITGDYLKAFSGLEKLMRTPMPFPLVQMAKMFLLVWTFTLPFVLNHGEPGEYNVFWLMILDALITFGFLGLEFVAMELSDNFGDDPADFDNMGYAELCQEDCYIAISKLDGHDWGRRLKGRVQQRLEDSELDYFSRKYHDDWLTDRPESPEVGDMIL